MGLLTLFVFSKAIVWWLVFGVFRRVLGFIRRSEFVQMTARGLNYGVGLLVLDVVLCGMTMLGEWATGMSAMLAMGLTVAVFISELLTLGGLLRGDWNFSSPRFRVIGLSAPSSSTAPEYHTDKKPGGFVKGGFFYTPDYSTPDTPEYWSGRV